jgi:hypothetical protein
VSGWTAIVLNATCSLNYLFTNVESLVVYVLGVGDLIVEKQNNEVCAVVGPECTPARFQPHPSKVPASPQHLHFSWLLEANTCNQFHFPGGLFLVFHQGLFVLPLQFSSNDSSLLRLLHYAL